MQSEDFDKKIREAAEHHHPAYNEMAWAKMERLLDTHMPTEKKDRKGFLIFFLLFFLLLGGGAWLFTAKPWEQSSTLGSANNETVQTEQQQQAAPAQPLPADKISLPGQTGNKQTETTDIHSDNSTPPLNNNKTPQLTAKDIITMPQHRDGILSDNDISIIVNPGKKSTRKTNKITTATKGDKSPAVQPAGNDNSTAIIDKTTVINQPGKDNKVDNNPRTENSAANPVMDANKTEVTAGSKLNEKVSSDSVSDKTTQPKQAKKKTVKKMENGISFTVSAGPDFTTIGIQEGGKLRPVYGVGLGYTFANRFTVRTGFYSTRKLYTAAPAEYKSVTPPPNYAYLTKVDADCKVYEIPLTVSYQFGLSEKHSWFASTGLSSYLMKEEKYDYSYKYPNGQTSTHNRVFENANKHLFSILALSAGYTRKINKNFSFTAEPYLRVPLTGIGQGRIKLNSAGVLFTLGVQPFHKNKSRN